MLYFDSLFTKVDVSILVSIDLSLNEVVEFARLHFKIKLFIDSFAALKDRFSALLFELTSRLIFLTTLPNHLLEVIVFVLA